MKVTDAAKHRDFVVFLSWQSDLPSGATTTVIRACLREASTRLEAAHAGEGLRVVLDEATRGEAGSPNIPQTILGKIAAADAVVCDMTTINAGRAEGTRAVPNPNVAIELGYAVGRVGWGRIVMLFNRAFGAFPDDLPFDVDRHRASPFEFAVADPKGDADGLTKKQRTARRAAATGPLCDLLTEALGAIWTGRPARPADAASPKQLRRARDAAKLREVMLTLHLPTLDDFLDGIGIGQFPNSALHFYEGLNATVSSRLFHLHDEAARKLVTSLRDYWSGCLAFDHRFRPNVSHTIHLFRTPGDRPFTSEEQRDWDEMQRCVAEMRQALDGLLAHVRAGYAEIDPEDTSRRAWESYVRLYTGEA